MVSRVQSPPFPSAPLFARKCVLSFKMIWTVNLALPTKEDIEARGIKCKIICQSFLDRIFIINQQGINHKARTFDFIPYYLYADPALSVAKQGLTTKTCISSSVHTVTRTITPRPKPYKIGYRYPKSHLQGIVHDK